MRSKAYLTNPAAVLELDCRCGKVHVLLPKPGAGVVRLRPAPRCTIPPRVRRQVDRRDSTGGARLCIHCGSRRDLHRHHRRIKGIGGDSRVHTDCACNIVTLCAESHHWAHVLNRPQAVTEGLIIPASAAEPWLWPVMVRGGGMAWPACTGRYIYEAPARAS
jgi:hypothetical protein